MNLYSVYDNVAKEFGSPFLQQNNESATRHPAPRYFPLPYRKPFLKK